MHNVIVAEEATHCADGLFQEGALFRWPSHHAPLDGAPHGDQCPVSKDDLASFLTSTGESAVGDRIGLETSRAHSIQQLD
mmetsp:Transcript_10413/g.24495  ORF Transcript_10413/g.24495 Transcript_10413/m.24495 type:complete len:80 (+) Transcript_10413:266-505(+)